MLETYSSVNFFLKKILNERLLMKKIIISFFIIAFAAGAGAYFYLAKAPVLLPTMPEELLPEETAFFLQIKNIEKNIKEINQNKLGKNLKKIDFVSTAKKLELPKDTIQQIENIKSGLNSKINQKIFYNFFGKNISLALVSLNFETDKKKDIYPNDIPAAFLIEPNANAKFSQMISEAVPEIKTIEDIKYKDTTITKAKYKDSLDFYHFIKNEYIVLTLNLETAQKIHDVKKEENSLGASKRFANLKNKITSKERDFFLYADTERIYSKIEKSAQNNQSEFLLNAQKRLNKDLNSVVLCGFDRSDAYYESKSDVELNYKNNAPKEKAKRFLSMVPDDLVTFSWQNNFDFEKLLKDIFNDKDKIIDFEQRLLTSTQIEPKTLYNGFKGELGIIFTDTDTKSMFPVPHIAFIFNKKAGPVFDMVFDSVQKEKNNSIPVQDKTLGSVKIKSVPLPLGASIEPSWGYFNDYFIVSMNTLVFQEIIDAAGSENSIENNKDFQFIRKKLPKEFNMISFVNSVKFFDNLASSGQSLIRLAAFKAPDLTEKGQIFLDEIFVPLCDGLSVYEAFGNASVFDESKLYGTGIVKKAK
jgi:hypothetical protein